MTNEQINKLITEARGGCWHEMGDYGKCIHCDMHIIALRPRWCNTDYTTDANACVELWKTSHIFAIEPQETSVGKYRWMVRLPHGQQAVYESTFCLAICKAYLKSKGIELENER